MLDNGKVVLIVPTYEEVPSQVALLAQEILDRLPWAHVWVVDDSPPAASAAFATALAQKLSSTPGAGRVVVLQRQSTNDTGGGLGGAVRYAMGLARDQGFNRAIVMDGDRQHPAGPLPAMAAVLEGYDLVVATRYSLGGSPGQGLSPVRRAVSLLATWFARLLFPRAIGGCSDPMSGFFGVNLDVMGPYWSENFKVLAHIMAQHPRLSRAEVPYEFQAREEGTSKATLKQGGQYLKDMLRLRLWLMPGRNAVPQPVLTGPTRLAA